MAVININAEVLYPRAPMGSGMEVANQLFTNRVLATEDAELSPSGNYIAITQQTNPVENPFVISGSVAGGTLVDLYERILVSPPFFSAGNVTSDQVVNLVVWNAYTSEKTLQSITPINATGLSLLGPSTPTVFNPLQSYTYELTILTDGPATIDAQFQFDWTGTVDDFVFPVTGARIVLVPFFAGLPLDERLSWKTGVITSENETEQRFQLRKNARQSVKLTYPLQMAQVPLANNLFYGWIERKWGVPFWPEAQQIATVNNGDDTVLVDTTACDYRVGSAVCIWVDPTTLTTAEILAITPTSLQFDRPITGTFTTPWLVPIRLGSVVNTRLQKTTNGNGAEFTVDFLFSDNTELDTTTPTQFLSTDIYFDDMLMNADRTSIQMVRRTNSLDYDTGITPVVTTRSKQPRLLKNWRFVMRGLTDVWNFRKWLHRRSGQAKSFWMPSHEPDMRLAQTGTVTNSLIIYDDGYELYASNRTHIAILSKSGTWYTRTITGVSDFATNQKSLALDSAVNIPAADVIMICWLGLYRFANDDVTIRWGGNRSIQCDIGIVEIQP